MRDGLGDGAGYEDDVCEGQHGAAARPVREDARAEATKERAERGGGGDELLRAVSGTAQCGPDGRTFWASESWVGPRSLRILTRAPDMTPVS